MPRFHDDNDTSPTVAPRRPITAGTRRRAQHDLDVAAILASHDDILASLVSIHERAQDQAAAARQLIPTVLWSGSVLINAAGQAQIDARAVAGAITLLSPTSGLTAAAMQLQDATPGVGPGVFAVPQGLVVTLNARTETWTLYGATPGAVVNATLWSRPIAAVVDR